MGKSFFDQVIINECDSLIAKIEKHDGKPFEISEYFINYTKYIIHGVIFGKSFAQEDKMFEALRIVSKYYYAAISELDGFYSGIWIYLKKRLQFNTFMEMKEARRLLYECTLSRFRERLNSETEHDTKQDLLDYYIDAFKSDTTNTFTGKYKELYFEHS
ncbi:hypothetical protein B4U80_14458 [Leptotrombidium deliense]|uniref:Uncharacterized protein n=1 Tax=Leptotrombidium deliense TaxID=299467 RepID=A0A443RVY1_9ACAR|nr:hypothetical protein B4U80_14458 [Leptotrombidium deliense]